METEVEEFESNDAQINAEINPVDNEIEGMSPMSTNETIEINIEPFIGMVFESETEAYQLYNEYSKQMGFGIRKKLCRRSKVNNVVIAGWYVCSRQGVHVRREKTANPRLVMRVGCPALLKVKRVASDKWKVTDFVKEHNHELDQENARLFWSHRKKAHASKTNLFDIVSRNVGLREVVDVVDKREPKFLSAADTHLLHLHFMRMRSKHHAFSYAMHLDSEQRVRSAFWADAASKVAYTCFGDVVTLDTSYLVNRYKVPLVSFVGANRHGQMILLGCALLADDTSESYEWLFRTWLETMSGQPPNAVITERNKSIAMAVKEVFPETFHRFCLGHVLSSISEKLGYVCRDQEKFMKKLNKCAYDSITKDEFETRWWKLINCFGLSNDKWLQELYDDRPQWAIPYLKQNFFGGMSISQGGETLSSIFDKYIGRSTNLKEFMEKYEITLKSSFEEEDQEDIRSVYLMSEERTNPSPFELQMSKVYTRTIFEKFQAEVLGISSLSASKVEVNGENVKYLVKAYEVQEDDQSRKVKEREYNVVWNPQVRKIDCICHLFEFKGYLCRHALAVLLASGVLEIPSHYIMKRWKKDVKTLHVLNMGFNGDHDISDSIAQRFNDICVRCIKLAQEASLSEKSYHVALYALQEALQKVVYENDYPKKVGQQYNSRSTGCHKVSGGTQ